MAQRTARWFLSLQLTLYLVLILVGGNEDIEDAYKNESNLVLEYFLPVNLPDALDAPMRREKRDVEGSGEEDSVFSELKEKSVEDADNSTRSAFAKLILEGGREKPASSSSIEGSGEIEEVSENLKEGVPIIADLEVFTTTESDEAMTEMISGHNEVSTTVAEQVTTTATESPSAVIKTYTKEQKATTFSVENTTKPVESRQNELTTPTIRETTTAKLETTTVTEETTLFEEATTFIAPDFQPNKTSEVTTALPTTTTEEIKAPLIPVVISQKNISEPVIILTTNIPSTQKFLTPSATERLPDLANLPTTPKPIVEEILRETKVDKKLEALPGNVLQKENLSLAADTLLIANTRLMDSEENVQLGSSEPKRLGAYIVIGLILLSFSSLVGYITFKKRMSRKRQEFESNQESNDTEKALLSLSDYKDNSELEENHLKNNEITPMVVKSNSQINKFEKNTNFSSPKNLNTIANEKNIEKDNVLKSTAENLTQVIIEDSPKDLEEDKNAPGMEKLIVKTRIDQDSIPKKPIIINRSSTGYLPIPQDNS